MNLSPQYLIRLVIALAVVGLVVVVATRVLGKATSKVKL